MSAEPGRGEASPFPLPPTIEQAHAALLVLVAKQGQHEEQIRKINGKLGNIEKRIAQLEEYDDDEDDE